jgi:hypothetical protein
MRDAFARMAEKNDEIGGCGGGGSGGCVVTLVARGA